MLEPDVATGASTIVHAILAGWVLVDAGFVFEFELTEDGIGTNIAWSQVAFCLSIVWSFSLRYHPRDTAE